MGRRSATPWPASRLLEAASYAALWAGLYVVAAVVCLAQLTGLDARADPAARLVAAGFAFCTASAVYLLDRVKLRDACLDPADELAHPLRFAFAARHSRTLRAAMTVLLALGAYLGWRLHPLGALLPLLAMLGVLIYAGRPRASRPRPKDVVLLKNFYVAAGITGFASLVALAAAAPHASLGTLRDSATQHLLPLAVSGAFVAMRVFADAALCDLDDADADRRFGTQTLPVRLGRTRAWNTAMAIRLGSSVAIVPITALPLRARLAWAGVTVVSSIALRVASPARVRDLVDARFALEAALVTAILIAF